jgi:hypothetical protein
VIRNRARRGIIATIVTLLWLGYMVVGLQVIARLAPTVNGNGPDGLAAFIGLVSGVVAAGFVMWAASE